MRQEPENSPDLLLLFEERIFQIIAQFDQFIRFDVQGRPRVGAVEHRASQGMAIVGLDGHDRASMSHEKVVVLQGPAHLRRRDNIGELLVNLLTEQANGPPDLLELVRGVVADALVSTHAPADLVHEGGEIPEFASHRRQMLALRRLQIRQEDPQPATGGQCIGNLQQVLGIEHRLLPAELLEDRADIPKARHGDALAPIQYGTQLGRLGDTHPRPTDIHGRIEPLGRIPSQVTGRERAENSPDGLELQDAKTVFINLFASHLLPFHTDISIAR